ncbi:MAG: adenosine deaminase [Candidatus Eremiobacteraeota bacterium]|nr:adenosine deaminase [Candidatus Eremiobacteraeota bacterium]
MLIQGKSPQSNSSAKPLPKGGPVDICTGPVDGFQASSYPCEWKPIKVIGSEPDPKAHFVSEAQFRQWMTDMPKAELHTHVEGAVRPQTILDIAEEYKLPLPAPTVEELKVKIGMRQGEDLLAFLKKFDHFRFVFDQPETLQRLAYECIEDNARENIQYTELRINPRKNTEKVSIEQVLDSVLAGMDKAKKELGVDGRLIASINRSYPVESAMDIAKAAVARKDRGIVGLDLAGDEVNHPASKFAEVFDYAKANGLHLTVHAGEARGPESVLQAVELCHAERIGHGVRLQEDPAAMQVIKEKGTVLEMCPESNKLLNVTPDLKAYPLKTYMHYGIPVTINTDDRHIFDVDLSHEFTSLAKNIGLSLQDCQKVAMNAVEAAFLPAEEKAQLKQSFASQMQAFSSKLYQVSDACASERPAAP